MKTQLGKTTEDESVAADETSAVGVPLLIPVVAPRITVKACNKGDDEFYERLKEIVKSTIDEKLLRALFTYHWGGLSKDDVTDDHIMSEVQTILQRVKNDTLPDVDRLFGNNLRLDTSKADGEHGSKEKCKLLIESLSPSRLKLVVKNVIRFQAPAALKDECKATEEEKKELPKKFHSNRAGKTRMKRIKERLGGVRTIKNFEELARLRLGVCLIIEEDDDEFIVDIDVLLSLGIDNSRQLEQLAGNRLEQGDDPFDIEDDAQSGLMTNLKTKLERVRGKKLRAT
ncbi:Hypothetical protein PHPALM_19674 [Phytophthora palmivora]|uniref:Uncharacterized protein n=1 Tax=Phytophthora palmivora TaxID=4796 RepID=A0A2P4XGV6_9STRA|nr:Hypothetical protein PHPALM_19674 [Phytophthora palmivora]